MKSRDEEREERRQYHSDVDYEVWRRGGNPDRVDYDRVEDRYYNGHEADATARAELERMRPRPQEPEQEQVQEQMPMYGCDGCGKPMYPEQLATVQSSSGETTQCEQCRGVKE